ncbi:MAG: amidohydrolase family protein [Steroidobacteraceae bacterium]|nr:amidohydrolase family protein [Steroidobacteraceae bacterium]
MRFRRGLFALVLAACTATAAAQPVVVRAGRVLDVEHGRYLLDQAIRIDDGRIVSVTPWGAGARGGAQFIDWSRYTVLPGLIDLHTHLVGDVSSADVAAPLSSSAARDALIGAAHARATLAAGFTTVRDVGTYRAQVDVALRNAINSGLVEGPRMFVAGAYVTVTDGGGEVTGLPEGTVVPEEMRRGVADDEAAVRLRVRELLANGADFIKIIATGAVFTSGTTPSAPEYSEQEIRAAVEEAAKAGTYVVAHAHGAEGIKNAVRAGVRSIEHGSYLDDEGIALMKKHGTWLVADVYNGDYTEEVGHRDGWSEEILRKNRETTDIQREGFRKAVKAGVRIGYGTDAGIFPHGANARQFAYMVRFGMTPIQAIRAATVDAAASLGRAQELGTIAPGHFADLIAVDCDPLAGIACLEHVSAVIKDGHLFDPGD